MCPLYICDTPIIEAGEDTEGQVLAMYCEGQCKIWLHTQGMYCFLQTCI